MKFLFTFLILLNYLFSIAQCDGKRYFEQITTELNTYADIQYGSNLDNKNQQTDLLMTVYEPKEESIPELRPLIIFVHGGSFISGDRNDQHLNETAQFFAKKGYVSANIEYRLEQTNFLTPYLNFADKNNWYKAMVRAVHDIRACIRYFKKDVAENGNVYQIDTNRIILYGSSAGAIASLHTVFIDNLEEASPAFRSNFNQLGGFEGNSGNDGYTSIGVKAVINNSGAIDNVNYLNNNTDIALISFHHTTDFTVPYDKGCFVTVACFLGDFYGSNPISKQAKKLGMNYEFYPINKVGHPADSYNDTATYQMILKKSTDFLYNNVICTDTLTPIANRQTRIFNVYPNPSSGIINIENSPELFHQECTLQVVNEIGVLVQEENFMADKINRFNLNTADGIYILRVISNKDNTVQYISRLSVVK